MAIFVIPICLFVIIQRLVIVSDLYVLRSFFAPDEAHSEPINAGAPIFEIVAQKSGASARAMMQKRSSVPILVINLNRDIERLKYIQKLFADAALTFERIEAVDGHKLSELAGAEIVSVIPSWRFPRGLALKDQGLTMSHRKAALRVLDRGWPIALIMEDDVGFSAELKSLVVALASNPPADFVKLEGIDREGFAIPVRQIEGRTLALTLAPTMGAAGYLITRRGAQCILNLTSSAWGPADHVLAQAALGASMMHVLPYPIYQRTAASVVHAGVAEMCARPVSWPSRVQREAFRLCSQIRYLARIARDPAIWTCRPSWTKFQEHQ